MQELRFDSQPALVSGAGGSLCKGCATHFVRRRGPRRSIRILSLIAAGMLTACSAAPGFRSDATGAASPWTAVPQHDPAALRFVLIGDRTGLARPGVFEQAVRQIGWLQPEFVVNVGDLLEGYTEDRAALEGEWRHIEQAISELDRPFFFVPGNHDLGNGTMLELWKQRRGAPWYYFVYKDVLFLCMDTEDPPMPMPEEMAKGFRETVRRMAVDPLGTERALHEQLAQVNTDRDKGAPAGGEALNAARFSEQQIGYFRRVIREHEKVRWTFVLMHKPAWDTPDSNFREIEALLASRPYTVVAGHNHYYRHETRQGRDYITMGTAGGISHQEGVGRMDHIAWVTLNAKAPRIALIKLTGLLDTSGQSGQTLAR